MIEVHKNLFVGSQGDASSIHGHNGWFVVHACKEPYHRQALGYTGRGAPKSHPEYLIARRESRLILNLVDVDDVNYIAAEIIDAALSGIDQNIGSKKVLVHCNQGFSRSPAIAFLYLLKFTELFRGKNCQQDFVQLYPHYAPAKGMADYVTINWSKYASRN